MRLHLSVVAPALSVLLALVPTALAAADDYFEAPASAAHNMNTTGFTVEAWVNVRSLPGENPHIVCGRLYLGNNDSDVWSLAICRTACADGRLTFGCRSNGLDRFAIHSSTPINIGGWHHVAGTYDGNVAHLYVDGIPEDSATVTGVTCLVAGGYVYLGQRAPGRNDQFDGLIDEVRLWSVARTPTEIENARYGEIAPQANLVGYWRLNGSGEDLGTGAVTFAPHGNVGFLAGQFAMAGDIHCQPPFVLTDPQDQAVIIGQPATFTVSATGHLPLSYQWRKDNAPITGATDSTYTIPSVVAGDRGAYDVIVSGCGVDTSAVALLLIDDQSFPCFIREQAWSELLSVAVDGNGHVYASDGSGQIWKFTTEGGLLAVWGSYGSGDGQYMTPSGLALDDAGNLYVADTYNDRIQRTTNTGTFLAKWGTSGVEDGELRRPTDVAIDGSGNVIVVDSYNDRIQKFTSSGTFLARWGSSGSGDGEFFFPQSIAVDLSGNIYVGDNGNARMQKFGPTGTFLSKWGSYGSAVGHFMSIQGMTVDASGAVYVADAVNDRIQKFTSTGAFRTSWGASGSGDGEFSYPTDIAIDSSGNVYVTEIGNHRMQRFSYDPGLCALVGVEPSVIEPGLQLGQAVPNPWIGQTTLSFSLAHTDRVSLAVYDLLGRLLREWSWPSLGAGPHQIVWDGRASDGRLVAAGIMFCRMDSGGQVLKKKLVRLQ